MMIHVHIAPAYLDQIATDLRAAAKLQSNTDIDDAFEVVCSQCITMGAQSLCFTQDGFKLVSLLETVSEALPHLFDINVVTKRVKTILNKICVDPPPIPNEEDPEADASCVIDIAARIVANVSGEISRNHADQRFTFRSSSTDSVIAEFVVSHGPSFVTVQTAGLLWPGATAFACLVVARPAPVSEQVGIISVLQSVLDTSSTIVEIGCGLGLLSCAVAARIKCRQQLLHNQQLRQQRLICTDLFESAAVAAKKNVVAVTAHNNVALQIEAQALDWNDEAMRTRLIEAAVGTNSSSNNSNNSNNVIVGSEVFFDAKMGTDVAQFLAAMLQRENSCFSCAFILVMDRRPGLDEFVSTLSQMKLRCERFRDVIGIVAAGEPLKDWSLFYVSTQ